MENLSTTTNTKTPTRTKTLVKWALVAVALLAAGYLFSNIVRRSWIQGGPGPLPAQPSVQGGPGPLPAQ